MRSRRPGRGRPRILVVEDSFTVRELQRSILEAAGYSVATARDGRDALAVLEPGAAISLVVTDLEMPGLDGIGLTRAIRADTARSSLPVVIVTSRAAEEDSAQRDRGRRGRLHGQTELRPAGSRSPPSSASSAGDEVTPLRVLICEDSRTYATALTRVLEHDGDITVVAVCVHRGGDSVRTAPHQRPTL